MFWWVSQIGCGALELSYVELDRSSKPDRPVDACPMEIVARWKDLSARHEDTDLIETKRTF